MADKFYEPDIEIEAKLSKYSCCWVIPIKFGIKLIAITMMICDCGNFILIVHDFMEVQLVD